jgi:hypothetical protein
MRERGQGKEEKSLGIAAMVQVYLRWDVWFHAAWIPSTRQNSKKLTISSLSTAQYIMVQ